MDLGQFSIMFRSIFLKDWRDRFGSATDLEEPGQALSVAGRRTSVAKWRQKLSRWKSRASGVELDNGNITRRQTNPLVRRARGNTANVRRSSATPTRAKPDKCRLSSRFPFSIASRTSRESTKRSYSTTTPTDLIGGVRNRSLRCANRCDLLAQQLPIRQTTGQLGRGIRSNHVDRRSRAMESITGGPNIRRPKLHWYDDRSSRRYDSCPIFAIA